MAEFNQEIALEKISGFNKEIIEIRARINYLYGEVAGLISTAECKAEGLLNPTFQAGIDYAETTDRLDKLSKELSNYVEERGLSNISLEEFEKMDKQLQIRIAYTTGCSELLQASFRGEAWALLCKDVKEMEEVCGWHFEVIQEKN